MFATLHLDEVSRCRRCRKIAGVGESNLCFGENQSRKETGTEKTVVNCIIYGSFLDDGAILVNAAAISLCNSAIEDEFQKFAT